jgi:hypothetical protein
MASNGDDPTTPHLTAALEPDEELHVQAMAQDAAIVVTDRRLIVAAGERLALAVPFEGLRRIQFDIERERPATMVIVPESPQFEPQVLAIPPDQYDLVARALALIGRRLAGPEASRTP